MGQPRALYNPAAREDTSKHHSETFQEPPMRFYEPPSLKEQNKRANTIRRNKLLADWLLGRVAYRTLQM